MSDTESRRESTDSSSEDETTTREELNQNDVRLQQMRRGAQKRVGQSRIAARLEGLVSYDDMLRQHAFQRMKEGLEKILSLHTPVELSSVCGCLGLKVQEKGSTSTHFIMQYAMESNNLDGERIKHIMNFLWEGALWEYLHSIGHPVHNMRPDPKKTILEIWEQGGLLGGNINGFVPHFIAREVKKRNTWIQSEDIQERLVKLRVAQDAAKSSERKVISEHDYTNILSYFNQMSALRRLEASVREYLISELEIARSRIDSCSETAKMTRDQLAENEMYYMRVVNTLNEQLALTESVCESRIAERYQLEGDLQRLDNVLESYLIAEENRESIGGGTVQTLRLKNVEQACPPVRSIHERMQKYKQVRDHMDNAMRAQARAQEAEVARLNEIVDALQAELEQLSEFATRETARADRAERSLFYAQRRVARVETKHKHVSEEAWYSSERFANKLTHQTRLVQRLKPAMMAALRHPHKTVYALSRAVLATLSLAEEEEMNIVYENACMHRQDVVSQAVRRAELARQAAMASPAAVANRTKTMKVKISSGKKKGGGDASSKSSSKAPGTPGKSSRASTPSEASRGGSRTATPKATASSRSGGPASSAKKKPVRKK